MNSFPLNSEIYIGVICHNVIHFAAYPTRVRKLLKMFQHVTRVHGEHHISLMTDITIEGLPYTVNRLEINQENGMHLLERSYTKNWKVKLTKEKVSKILPMTGQHFQATRLILHSERVA